MVANLLLTKQAVVSKCFGNKKLPVVSMMDEQKKFYAPTDNVR